MRIALEVVEALQRKETKEVEQREDLSFWELDSDTFVCMAGYE